MHVFLTIMCVFTYTDSLIRTIYNIYIFSNVSTLIIIIFNERAFKLCSLRELIFNIIKAHNFMFIKK